MREAEDEMRGLQVKPSAISSERENIRRALSYLVADLVRYLKESPEDYTEHGTDEPSIDVRLCFDEDGWILRHGSVDFDPYHSAVCAASCVTLETEVEDLLEELISGALDQCAMLEREDA